MGELGQDHAAAGGPSVRSAPVDAHDLGPALLPALHAACHNKLSDVRWFRTDWQTGGAATAFATFASETGPRDVVIKIPIGPREHRVITTLASSTAPTPRVAASGLELGGYDLAWVVMERFPGVPLSAKLHHDVFEHLAVAAARFQAACAAAMPIEPAKPQHDWDRLIERARECIRANETRIPHAHKWLSELKHVHRALPRLLTLWNSRRTDCWCHGDLHPGNCMERPASSPWGEAGYVLLDFAEVHPGHWVEDAVYMERQFWARPQVMGETKPVTLMAKARRDLGLDTSDDYGQIANVRRVLMAATTPAFLEREGHPSYLEASLHVLERTMPMLVK
jgi:hypothetical protein